MQNSFLIIHYSCKLLDSIVKIDADYRVPLEVEGEEEPAF